MLAGDKLNVAVVDNTKAAAALLAWQQSRQLPTTGQGKLWIWPLKELQLKDNKHKLKQAQAAFRLGAP